MGYIQTYNLPFQNMSIVLVALTLTDLKPLQNKGYSNESKYTVGRRRNRKRANLGLLRQGWQRVIEMRTKATACAIHSSLRAQHQTKVRLTHHDDGTGSFHWLKIIAATIAPVSMFKHHFSRERGQQNLFFIFTMYKVPQNFHLRWLPLVSHSRGPHHLQWHKPSFWVRRLEERYMKIRTPCAQSSGSRHLQHTLLGRTSIRKLPNSYKKKDTTKLV